MALLSGYVSSAPAQTTYPSTPGLRIQTSGARRCAHIGDWYTTAGGGSTPNCGPVFGSSSATTSFDQIHRFTLDVTEEMLSAGGGTVTVTINDAESNGALDEVSGSGDPTRYELLDPDGAVLQSQLVPSGSPDGTTVTFFITTPGTYQVTSLTGQGLISGAFPSTTDPNWATTLNNDDNTFTITTSQSGLMGQFQSSFQHDTGGTLTLPFYFLVGPGTGSLFLRNFDQDNSGSITYTRPGGGSIGGSVSGNGRWNGGGSLNSGGDTIAGLATNPPADSDVGIWGLTMSSLSSNNQVIIEVNGGSLRLVVFDQPPTQAGNFTITPDTTRATTLATPVNHPFTVTNSFLTPDIINLSLTGTAPNYTIQLLDGSSNPLSDTDNDGNPDTGIMATGATQNFILRVTPVAGAVSPDITRINAVSYMDTKVGPSTNTTRFIEKTTTLLGVSVSGTVYHDSNHNAHLDSSETGTALTLFAKLFPTSTPTGPALQVVPVNPATGAYTFTGVTADNYSIVIDNNNTSADVTPTLPSAWVGTEMPTQIRSPVVVANTAISHQNFGLFNGSRLTGTVFQDIGIGSGAPNNGIQDGSEIGMANVTVAATDGSSTTYDTTTTTSTGGYTLFLPASAATVHIVETNPGGFVSTGATAGSTGGTYDRATDTVSFTHSAGTIYSGVDFGDVPDNSFAPDGQQTALPGTVVFYPHTFTAGTGGTVTFSATSLPNPSINGWSHVLYRDTDCSSTLESSEPVFTGTLGVTANAQICIIVKEFVPANAPAQAQDQITVAAHFTYDNAVPALAANVNRTDITIVGAQADAGLILTKNVDKSTAFPGEVLTYTLTYANNSSDDLSTLTVHDATPAFTTFVNASCVLPLPTNLTSCTVTMQPAVGSTGAITWTLTGTLTSGASGAVQYQVGINQ